MHFTGTKKMKTKRGKQKRKRNTEPHTRLCVAKEKIKYQVTRHVDENTRTQEHESRFSL